MRRRLFGTIGAAALAMGTVVVAARAPRTVLLTAVAERERMSRDTLVRTADMHFSGLELNDGKGVYPFSDRCARLENGSVTAGEAATIAGPAANGRAAPPSYAATPARPSMSCRA